MAIVDWTKETGLTVTHTWTRDTVTKYAGASSGKQYVGAQGSAPDYRDCYIYRPATGNEVKIYAWLKFTRLNNQNSGYGGNVQIGHSSYGKLTVHAGSGGFDWTRYRAIFFNSGGRKWGWLSKWNGSDWEDVGSQPIDFGAGSGSAGNVEFRLDNIYYPTSSEGALWIDEIYVYKKP